MAYVAQDISPDSADGNETEASSAGLTLAIAGSEHWLYGISLNAGVWKNSGTKWAQLSLSPPHAYCIAVDPNDSNHVAVGERDGDAIDLKQNQSGLWESTDGGSTWSYVFDPLSQGCPFQVVPAVAFTPKSTIVVATTRGIFLKKAGMGIVTATLPGGLNTFVVTAVVASATKVWARLKDWTLLVSTDDGATWKLATSKPMPTPTWAAFGDDFSLGAFDSAAFMITKGDDVLDKDGNAVNSYSGIIIYDEVKDLANQDPWLLQSRITDDSGNAALNNAGPGGPGGRRFLKSYNLGNSPQLGQGSELFFCNGQGVLRAMGRNNDGTLFWKTVASTPVYNSPAKDPVFQNEFHSDIWDFHWASNGRTAWVVGDGGVFQNRMDGNGWQRWNRGLHTHHVHTLTVVSNILKKRARLAYATSDNDAWTWDEIVGWQTPNVFGDANWTDGDSGYLGAVLLARALDVPWLSGFNSNLPTGGIYNQFVLNNDSNLDIVTPPRAFLQFIQTPIDEDAGSNLDAVMLVELPLKYRDDKNNLVPVPGQLGDGSQVGIALIRNQKFMIQPDVNKSQYQGWELEGLVPVGTKGFWVSGGHADPVYYVYTAGANGIIIYRREVKWGIQRNKKVGTFVWNPLNVNGLLDGAIYGPAHINPYNPLHLYVLSQDGVKSSTDGGSSFITESLLTSRLTAGGKYPFTRNYAGFNSNLTSTLSRAVSMATLSHMAFNRYAPSEVVAASPYVGVFFNRGDVSGNIWDDLTQSLPTPCAPVSSVGIDHEAIYVGTEGRGVLRLTREFVRPKPYDLFNPLWFLFPEDPLNEGLFFSPLGQQVVEAMRVGEAASRIQNTRLRSAIQRTALNQAREALNEWEGKIRLEGNG